MSKRDRQKARAQIRNARRASTNAITAAEVLGPEEARRQSIRETRAAKAEAERRRARRLNTGLTDPPPDVNVLAKQEAADKQRALADNLTEKAKARGKAGAEARKMRRSCLDQARVLDRAAQDARDAQLEAYWRFMDQSEITAQAIARGEKLDETRTEIVDWLRDEHGGLVREKGMPILKVERASASRRALAEIQARLRRFKDLNEEQIGAAVRLEKDWDAAGLEPRMVANLLGSGGGSQGGVADAVIDARTRVHHALSAIRLGGPEVLQVVESIIIRAATSTDAAVQRYADPGRQNAHVAALLAVGLNLLSQHYKLRSAQAAHTRSATKTA